MYRRGKPGDEQDILDFINYVFCHAHEPIDFRRLLPKAYGEHCGKEDIHHMIVENDRIKAVVGVYPATLTIADIPLKTGYIGSVSVHPYARGNGYMKELMQKANDQIVADGCALAIVSGQRQRYEYYGYYQGGQKYKYKVTQTNLRHYFLTEKDLSLEDVDAFLEEQDIRIQLQTGNNDEFIDAIYAIYQRRQITGRDREYFYEIMKSYDADLYAVTMQGVCIGYASVNYEEDHINELELIDISLLPYVIHALYQHIGIDATFIITTMLDREKNKILSPICERYTIGQAQFYHIIDYPLVIEALLKAKNNVKKLTDGKAVIEVMDQNKILIQIKDNEISVTETNNSPQVVLSEKQFMAIMLSTGWQQAVLYEEVDNLDILPTGWFPLPLCVPEADTF